MWIRLAAPLLITGLWRFSGKLARKELSTGVMRIVASAKSLHSIAYVGRTGNISGE